GAGVVCADDDHVDIVEAARSEVNGHRHYVATGSTRPDGWSTYDKLMSGALDDQIEAQRAGGLGASMIYPSGTTGHPKGAWRPNGVNVANILQIISTLSLSQLAVHTSCAL